MSDFIHCIKEFNLSYNPQFSCDSIILLFEAKRFRNLKIIDLSYTTFNNYALFILVELGYTE
jgi:hypothetical protein